MFKNFYLVKTVATAWIEISILIKWCILTSHTSTPEIQRTGSQWVKGKRRTFLNTEYTSIIRLLKENWGNSLVVQWLGLRALNAEGPGSIPGWGTKIHKPQGTAKINNFFLMHLVFNPSVTIQPKPLQPLHARVSAITKIRLQHLNT